MVRGNRKPLEEYLDLQYPFNVNADEDGGYVVEYPDLPGCLTQVEDLSELASMAEDARRTWIEAMYEDGKEIPLPRGQESFSGKFVLRIRPALHRSLAEEAKRDGLSLNAYVRSLLEERHAYARVERRLMDLDDRIAQIHLQVCYRKTEPARSPLAVPQMGAEPVALAA